MERTQFGKPLASTQLIQSKLANMVADVTEECYRNPAADEYRERRTLERGATVAPRFEDALELAVSDLLLPQSEEEE